MIESSRAFRPILAASVSISALLVLPPDLAIAQNSDLGSVVVEGAQKQAKRKRVATQPRRPAQSQSQADTANRPNQTAAAVPITSTSAIGSGAPAGSAPALAPSQGVFTATQPTSVVSDKVIRDIVPAGGDFNDVAKFTPGFVSSNANGFGDSKSGWRGFQDGQFNVTFDGIPFGDANDPSHHSAAYFPTAFLGRVTVDRGPGDASQIGYATFGGTLGLWSLALSDKPSASIQASYGNYNTFTTTAVGQSGLSHDGDARALVAFSHIQSSGVLQYGDLSTYQGLIKVEKQFGDVKVTALATGGTENYNNVNPITWAQYLAHGPNYGQVNGNPKSTQFYGYNNSQKATDLEYVKAETDVAGFGLSNMVYTYSYWYPRYQRNGVDQSIEGDASIANGGTLNKVTFPKGGTSYIYPITNGDVTGFDKFNNYRAVGDILRVSRDINAPFITGTLRTGLWYEKISNDRFQQYSDYTTGTSYANLGAASGIPSDASYKLNLTSNIYNLQPFVEYEWRPTDRLSITPGYKYENITRHSIAAVNQTTLLPQDYSHTYTANLPFLTARYRLMDNLSVYAQASKGFLIPTVSAYYVQNPDLNTIAPQTTTNYQVGAVYKTKELTVAAAIYQVTAANFPITTTTNGLTSYENGGTARYQGAELEGTFALTKGFAVYASGALMQAKYIDGQYKGLRVGAAPDYTVAGGLIYDDQTYFGSLLHKITGDQYGASGQKLASATTDPSLNKIGAYNSTDFVIGVRTDAPKRMGFGQRAELKIGVNNIFDHRNITDINGDPTGLTSINNNTLTYAFMPGRTYYASVKIDF